MAGSAGCQSAVTPGEAGELFILGTYQPIRSDNTTIWGDIQKQPASLPAIIKICVIAGNHISPYWRVESANEF
jgi:hypothetical protein